MITEEPRVNEARFLTLGAWNVVTKELFVTEGLK